MEVSAEAGLYVPGPGDDAGGLAPKRVVLAGEKVLALLLGYFATK